MWWKWRRFDDVRRKCAENEGVCLMWGENVLKWRCLADVRENVLKMEEGMMWGEKVLKNLENWTNFKEKRLMNKYVDKKVSTILIQRIYN